MTLLSKCTEHAEKYHTFDVKEDNMKTVRRRVEWIMKFP